MKTINLWSGIKEPGDEVPEEEYKLGTDNKGQVNSVTMSYT